MKQKRISFLAFLLGTFSGTQIRLIGSIGISELVAFLIAPFLFVHDYAELKRHRFTTAIWLAVLVMAGCAVSCVANSTPSISALKGLASPYSIFAILVVGHWLLSRNLDCYKWFFLGGAVSGIINIFIFQTGTELEMYGYGETGLDAVAGIMSSPIFWIGRLSPFVRLPISGWYLQTPLLYSVFAPIGIALFALLTTESGRSSALGALGTAAIIFIGKKDKASFRFLSKNLGFFLILAILGIGVANFGYRTAAVKGWLGEKSLAKYEDQTRGGKGVIHLLMGGRVSVFAGLYACLRKPIIGHGPWAIDYDGYYERFLANYGLSEDYDQYLKARASRMRRGLDTRSIIPAHSQIIGFWLWYGIFGLIFWIYVLWKIFQYFREDLSVMPQWFGALAAGIPGLLWGIFFSPFGGRVGFGFIFSMYLMAHAVRECGIGGCCVRPGEFSSKPDRCIEPKGSS